MDKLKRILRTTLFSALPLALATVNVAGCEDKKKPDTTEKKNKNGKDKNGKKKNSKGKDKDKNGKKKKSKDKDKNGKKKKSKDKDGKNKKSKSKKGKKGKKKSRIEARSVANACVGKLQGCWDACQDEQHSCTEKVGKCLAGLDINCLPAVPEDLNLAPNHGWIAALAGCENTKVLNKCTSDYDACAKDSENDDERLCFASLEECVDELPAESCPMPSKDEAQNWLVEEDGADEDEDEDGDEDEDEDGDDDEDDDDEAEGSENEDYSEGEKHSG